MISRMIRIRRKRAEPASSEGYTVIGGTGVAPAGRNTTVTLLHLSRACSWNAVLCSQCSSDATGTPRTSTLSLNHDEQPSPHTAVRPPRGARRAHGRVRRLGDARVLRGHQRGASRCPRPCRHLRRLPHGAARGHGQRRREPAAQGARERHRSARGGAGAVLVPAQRQGRRDRRPDRLQAARQGLAAGRQRRQHRNRPRAPQEPQAAWRRDHRQERRDRDDRAAGAGHARAARRHLAEEDAGARHDQAVHGRRARRRRRPVSRGSHRLHR